MLIQENEKNKEKSDSIRFADCIMTSLTIFVDRVESFLVDEMDYVPSIDETVDLCVQVLSHFRNSEEVCDKMCHVLTFVINLSRDYFKEHQKLSDQLVGFYQDSNFSCFIEPFLMIDSLRGYDAGCWEWILKHCIVIFEHAATFLTLGDSNNQPRFVERLMKLFQTFESSNLRIVSKYYDDILHSFDVGFILSIACQGLLSENEPAFHECVKALFEVFLHPSKSFCKARPKTNQIVERLYHSNIDLIIKNCVDVILSQRKIVFLKGCGDVLYLMNRTERCLVGTRLNIAQDLVSEALENNQDIVNPEKRIQDLLIKILNSTTKEEAESLVALVNVDA
ncbi:hypothetical protein RF11_09547 [Thelohanellus kitauei]|uniref:Uncharacterized protein n=1 Tax=Thelohanellus kitauei TaxID=669202 RepID=A0A0C2N477_THEKT|nr:hypothetical protein RF11_09547 [Thelohanellus kitauei]